LGLLREGSGVATTLLVAVVVPDGLVGALHELLSVAMAAAALAAVGLAAADGEEPEETGGEGKSSRGPDSGEELGVEVALNAVELGRRLDRANDNDRRGRRKSCSAHTAVVATAETMNVKHEKARLQLAKMPKTSSTARAMYAMMKTIWVQRETVPNASTASPTSLGSLMFWPESVIRVLMSLVVSFRTATAQLKAGLVQARDPFWGV